jgi:hypothetical protein
MRWKPEISVFELEWEWVTNTFKERAAIRRIERWGHLYVLNMHHDRFAS